MESLTLPLPPLLDPFLLRMDFLQASENMAPGSPHHPSLETSQSISKSQGKALLGRCTSYVLVLAQLLQPITDSAQLKSHAHLWGRKSGTTGSFTSITCLELRMSRSPKERGNGCWEDGQSLYARTSLGQKGNLEARAVAAQNMALQQTENSQFTIQGQIVSTALTEPLPHQKAAIFSF